MNRRSFFKTVGAGSMLLFSGAIIANDTRRKADAVLAFSTLDEIDMKFITRWLNKTRELSGKQISVGGNINQQTSSATLTSPNYPGKLWIVRLDKTNNVTHIRDIIASHNI